MLGSIEHCDFRLDFSEHLLHLLVLVVLASEVGGVLSEVVSLHVLASFRSGVFLFFLSHLFLKGLLLSLKLLDLSLLHLLLLGELGSLRFKETKSIVVWSVLLQFLLEGHAVSLESLDIAGQSLEFTLGGDWLLQKKLNSLESFSLVIEFSAKDVRVELSVFPGVVSQVLQHLVWAQVLVVDFLGVHQSLLHGEDLLLVELNHVGEFPLLLVQLSILLLFLSEFGSGLEECLEVLLVALVLEQVDFGEELLLLLLQLGDFFF